MGSADFSQFVVTTANETACETSTLKVRALSPHLPATFTGTSSNFWTSSSFADLSVFPSLICGSCSSGQGFAYSFLQIPPRDGHPCCSAMYFVVAYAYSGLSPVRARPWRANIKRAGPTVVVSPAHNLSSYIQSAPGLFYACSDLLTDMRPSERKSCLFPNNRRPALGRSSSTLHE